MTERTGTEILRDLAVSGRLLVFIDDSSTSGKPLPNLAADFEVMCAITMPSEAYTTAKSQLAEHLSSLPFPIAEFHATEIVNPPSKSPWRGASIEERRSTLSVLTTILADSVTDMLFCVLSGEQYHGEFVAKIRALGVPPKSTKVALKHVFYRRLLEYLRGLGTDVAVVADSETALQNAIKIHAVAKPDRVYEGGLIYVDSRDDFGVQMADLAAYMINRIYHSHQRLVENKANSIDELVVETMFNLRPKFKNLLNKDDGVTAHTG